MEASDASPELLCLYVTFFWSVWDACFIFGTHIAIDPANVQAVMDGIINAYANYDPSTGMSIASHTAIE